MSLRQRFGRALRLGVIGGGPGSWIGQMHRGAAEMDGCFRVTAGVFSSDAAKSREAGIGFGLDAARSYGTVAEMLRAENESLKAQLAQLRLEAQYELRVCAAPDLMQVRLAAIAAQQQVDALNAKPAAVDRKK